MTDRSDVPAGYVVERERDAVVVALPSVLQHVRALVRASGTLYHAAAAVKGARAFTGRGAALYLGTAHGDWVVRHYRRGGAVARLLDDRYLRTGEPRPLRELQASERARARGVDTPQVVACAVYDHGIFYRADIATVLVPDSKDLAELSLGGARDPVVVREAWRAAGALLARAFAAGVLHADLNLRNLLVQQADGVRVWLLDLDRAVVQDAAVSDVARRTMLERLHRSRRKLELAYGATVDPAALRAFDEEVRR